MKVIPKFQRGGGFESFFTTYIPVQVQAPSQTSQSGRSNGEAKTKKEKGELTEKDFFDMLKSVDGLPNEMSDIVGGLLSTFQMSNLTGVDPGDLATAYLSNLYKVKVATQNKKTYDEAIQNANKNGAMAEPAISMNGNLIIQKQDGSIGEISLGQYLENEDQYRNEILTVSNLANMRAYSPELAYNPKVFDIINNGVGFESFQALLKQAIQQLGTSEASKNGMFSIEGKALQGLALLNTLREDDRVQALGSVTAEGLYDYKIIDKDQLAQINALTSYITAVLPDRAKTWAALKTKNADKDQATKDLVSTYLASGRTTSHSFDLQYKGSMEKAQGTSNSKKSPEEDPKQGFWRQVQLDRGGDDFTYSLLVKNGRMSVNGKFYGTTPGMDSNKSLGDYIHSSGIGFIIKNNKNITFGDTKISVNSFNDVMINSNSGAAVVTLPIKADGTVDLSVAERWVSIQDTLKEQGLKEGTPEYTQKLKQLMIDNQLDGLLGPDGLPKANRFGHFVVLEGYTSEKAKAAQNNKEVSFKDIKSDFIVPAGDDNEIYDMVEKGLSNKDRGEYKFNRNWDWSLGYDNLYKGNIYIPINTNPISAYNADNNDIKESTAYLYEKAQQQKSTGSDVL